MTHPWLLVFALLAPKSASSPAPLPLYPLETLLASPVSPGAIALLVPHLADDRARTRVLEALAHSDPAVRGSAARVAGVAEIREAGPILRRVLESESDPSAAAEQIHALVPLTSGADDRGLIPLAVKHGLVGVLGDALAGVRGPAALTLLPALLEAGPLERFDSPDFVAVATRGGREGLNIAATSVLREGDPKRWASLLALARRPGAVMAPGLLVAAVRSPKPELRAGVYWHLALSPSARSRELDDAIARAPESVAADTADPAAAFALVVLKRAEKGPKFGGEWGDRAGPAALALSWSSRAEPALAALLTEAEGRAVSLRLTDGRDAEWVARSRKSPGILEGLESSGISFAGGLPPGTLRDMMAVTGCKPGVQLRATGFVEYRADGRPRRVSVAEPPDGRGCAEIAVPALGLSVAPRRLLDTVPTTRRTVVVIPLNRAALDCAEEAEPPKAERAANDGDAAGPGTIKEPRKVKTVAPWFPRLAREQRRQGVVILEAIISPSGCVRSTRVLKGVSPDLDAVAMIAVGQWVYTPTLLDGKPVPVVMTVTINFRLS